MHYAKPPSLKTTFTLQNLRAAKNWFRHEWQHDESNGAWEVLKTWPPNLIDIAIWPCKGQKDVENFENYKASKFRRRASRQLDLGYNLEDACRLICRALLIVRKDTSPSYYFIHA